jgi:hypothetical protein
MRRRSGFVEGPKRVATEGRHVPYPARLFFLCATRVLRSGHSPLAFAGLLTVVLAAMLILTPSVHCRVSAASPPASMTPAAPDVADVLARAKALKAVGRLSDALQVVADAMQLPGASKMLTSPDLHWVQAWLLVALSEKTGSHRYLVDASDEFRSVITLAGAHTDLGRQAQRALDRIARRE